jgi:hypothetical protein
MLAKSRIAKTKTRWEGDAVWRSWITGGRKAIRMAMTYQEMAGRTRHKMKKGKQMG